MPTSKPELPPHQGKPTRHNFIRFKNHDQQGYLLQDKMSGMAIYLVLMALLLLAALITFRFFVRGDYLRNGHLSVFSSVLQALVFFLYGGFPTLYLQTDWPQSHVNVVLRIAGWAGILVGLAILWAGVFWLGLLRSLGRQSDILKENGFYRFSRNPQVLGCGLYIVGFFLLWPSWYALGWSLFFIPIMHVMVLTEEEHLRRIYDQDYQIYCERVPRYFGIPKR